MLGTWRYSFFIYILTIGERGACKSIADMALQSRLTDESYISTYSSSCGWCYLFYSYLTSSDFAYLNCSAAIFGCEPIKLLIVAIIDLHERKQANIYLASLNSFPNGGFFIVKFSGRGFVDDWLLVKQKQLMLLCLIQ